MNESGCDQKKIGGIGFFIFQGGSQPIASDIIFANRQMVIWFDCQKKKFFSYTVADGVIKDNIAINRDPVTRRINPHAIFVVKEIDEVIFPHSTDYFNFFIIKQTTGSYGHD